ncbi:hypothetical protein GF373_08485 [bacterium]|nr:hypothetical protein [bacterium]
MHVFLFLFITFIGTSIQAQTLPMVNTTHFASSGNCAFCHTGLVDEAGNDVSIDSHWRSAMMANSAKDPYFLAKVTAELEKFPALKSTIEKTCANCHMPMAKTQSTFNQEEIGIFGSGYLDPNHPFHSPARDGVSCTLCHQIQSGNLGQEPSFSGGYTIDANTEKPDRPIFSPFQVDFPNPMINASQFTPVTGAHIKQSALCGSCHTLYTPYLDENGEIAGVFPEQTIFLEWRHSAYSADTAEGKSCQDCHMPVAVGGVKTSIMPPQVNPKSPFGQHHFLGGNVFMVRLMNENREDLQLTANERHMQATLDRTIAQLTQATAKVEIVDTQFEDRFLYVDIHIQPLTGHKYPSGFPSRRAWLHVTVEDQNGTVIFESGRPNPDGTITGNIADTDPIAYEPHYDRIEHEDQVQIYQSVMGNTQNEVTYTLLSAAGYIKDNRLLPTGFDKATAETDYKPWGRAETDANFQAGSDRIRYSVEVADYTGPFRVTVRFLHHAVGFPFARDLESTPTEQVKRFLRQYQAADHTPTTVAEAEKEAITRPTTIPDWHLQP